MKIVKIMKPIVDILMFADFIILQSMKITGGNLHEILGLVLVFLMLVHLALNMKMIVRSFGNFGKLKAKNKISLVVDILLMLVFLTCIVTGLLSSEFILSVNSPGVISVIHRYTGMAGLVVMLVHSGLHLSPVLAKINSVYESKRLAYLAEFLIYCCMTLSLSVYAFRDVLYKESRPKMKAKNSHTDSRVIDSLPENDSVITHDNSENEKKDNDEISPQSQAEPEESLEEYLSRMNCTGCGRHCPLSAPQCGRGRSQQQQATEEYNQQYNTNETY